MRWNLLFVFYIKQFSRSKVYLGGCLLIFLLLGIRLLFSLNNVEREAYGQLPSEIAMIVQITSLFFILYFYRTLSNELLYGVQSFFLDGYKIMLEKYCALFMAHITYQTVNIFFVYVIYFFIFTNLGIEHSSFYLSLFRFLLVYMFYPLLLCLLYGFVVALVFGTKKISYLFIMLFWIFGGSISSEIFFPFFSKVYVDEWQTLLNIGLNNIMFVYISFIGFDMHWGNELKLLSWFLALIVILLTITIKWSVTRKERKTTIFIIVILLMGAVLSANSVLLFSKRTFSYADYIKETEYYMQISEVQTDLRYEIETYNIVKNNEDIIVEVEFSTLDTLEPTFQLYHAYPIVQIVSSGKPIHYERDGDIIKLQLLEEVTSLTFEYKILDTNFVPYTNGRIALLANVAWYPKKRSTHMYEMDSAKDWIEITEVFPSEESYLFNITTNGVLFCNLPMVGEVFKGESQAVTLIKGQGIKMTYLDYQIIYPADWPKMEDRLPEVISKFEQSLQEIQLLVPTSILSLPKNIVFSNHGLSNLLTSDHLVYNIQYNSAINSYDTLKDIPKNTLQLAVEKKGPEKLYNEWINMTSEAIRDKNGWYIDIKGRSSESFLFSTSEQEIIELVYHHFYQLTTQEKEEFLKQWYLLLDDDWIWNDVLLLIKEWR
ncbi:ABC transporter permease [Bacillus alkalicellulosilyticus]|uniref:ABC transporter permease n=1 Tax=Alkalihalobacterium alkalicellulosilyticum TaxID=1912214 RepID=UPI0009966AFA|nr:ABC transporter permease [Bacillus alkalicellulosilyticus]